MLRSIPALRRCEIMRPGYAVEYDYIPGTQVRPTLESKLMRNLYLAGQIIGTTGYEEAGALGIMAGINAGRRASGREPVVLGRDQAYIGVLIDDLVTKDMDEPYRMHTSQAEFRLLLRENNAEERLGGLAFELGLIDEVRHLDLERRKESIDRVVEDLDGAWITPNEETNRTLESLGCGRLTSRLRARDFLCRADGRIAGLQALGLVPSDLREDVAQEAETVVKYAGYVSRQQGEVNRLRKLEERVIPESMDYDSIQGMRSESREKLGRVRPRTVGQASRVAGVAPSDISILLVHIERQEREVVAAGRS
jgi:tRNA uridine 5-carboxymethylaminomethyl modification enzyme